MPRLLAVILAAAIAAPVLAIPAPAIAQDDWNVKRDPFDKTLVARFKSMLRRSPSDKFALRKLMNLYSRYRSIKLLIKEYNAVIKRKPNTFSAHVVLGHIYLSKNKRELALEHYQKAATLKPKAAAVQAALGDLYRRGDQKDKARAAYEAALKSARGKKLKKQLLKSLADIALGAGDIKTARGYYERYIKLDPKNLRARIDLGDALARHKKYKEAIKIFKDAEKRSRSDLFRRIEIVQRIGAAYENSGNPDSAIKEYRRAIKLSRNAYYVRKEMTSRIIDIYRKKQDLASLIRDFEKSWKVKRRKHFEWDTLARLYEESGLSDKAIDAYRKAVKKNRLELDTHRRLITLLENSGREAEALKQYERVIKIAPGEPRFQLELAQRYWRRGSEKQALKLLAKMSRQFARDGAVYAAISELYTRWGKEDLALKAYVKLTKIEPHEISHLVNLGEQYFQRNKKKKAVAIWKKIITRKSANNFARLGEVYAEHDMLVDALKMYNKAIKLEAKNPERYKGRAGVFERQRRWVQAIGDWEKVLELTKKSKANKPARREARRRVVSLLRRSGSYQLSRRVFQWRRAFNASPPDLESGYYLIEAHLRSQNWKKARATLERLLGLPPGGKAPGITPKDTDAMQQLVKVYRYLQKFDKAVALLLTLSKTLPGREREFYTQIAEIKTADRKDDEALYYARKALEKSPNDPIAHMRLAKLYQDMQEFDKAITSYEKSISLNQRNFKAYFALARLYEARDPKKTAELYRQVLKRSTDADVIDRAARAAITVEEMNGTLGGLEKIMAPLAFTFSHKKIYRRKLVELYGRYVPTLVRSRRLGNAATRASVNAELARLGQRGLKPLLEGLSDEDATGQQKIAVEVLGYLRNKAAAAPLVRLALKDNKPNNAVPLGNPRIHRRTLRLGGGIDIDLRIKALIAAGRLGDARTIPQLLRLRSNRSGPMREAAIFALGMTGNRKALPALQKALDDSLPSVQALACLGLARTRDRRIAPLLIKVMRDHDRRDPARAACAFGLGYIGAKTAVPALLSVLNHGNDEVQRLAAWSLGSIGDKRALSPLLAIYFSRHDNVRTSVAWALTALTSNRATLKPFDFTEYPSQANKYDPNTMARHLPGKLDAVPLLPALIVGQETALRAGLLAALSRHRDMILRVLRDLERRRDNLSLGPLTDGVAKAPASVQADVEKSLQRIGQSIFPRLSELASHPDSKVRALALTVIAKIDHSGASGAILAHLNDPAGSVRRAALRAAAVRVRRLGATRATALSAEIAKALSSTDWQQRLHAAEAMGLMGSPVRTKALIRALDDSNGMVRGAVARSLGQQRATSAISVLVRSAADSLRSVRLRAVAALAAIGTADSRTALATLAKQSRYVEVKRAARRLLGQKP